MMNLEFFNNLNPSIILKILEENNIIKNDKVEENKLLFLLKTKRYSDIRECINKLKLNDNIVNYLNEQIKFSEDKSYKYISNLNDNVNTFYKDSIKLKNEFEQNKYSKKIILNYNSMENISYSENLFFGCIDLALYLFNINKLDESLNILNILEKINKYNQNDNLNIFWGQFYIYFLKNQYNIAYDILLNKIYNEISKYQYDINIYSCFVKYLYLIEYYINNINYDYWLKIINIDGFNKALELEVDYLLPHIILINIVKDKNLDNFLKILNICKISKDKHILYNFITNYYKDFSIDNTLLVKIERFLNEFIIYKNKFLELKSKIKTYLLKYLSRILEKISYNQLMIIFNFNSENEMESWLLNSILENNINIEIKENIVFFISVKKENNERDLIYKKVIDLVKNYKN